MLIDQLNAASTYTVTRDLPTQEKNGGKPDTSQESGLGQSGDAGPAVVTSFSSAGLETSRAVQAADQTSDQNGAGRSDNKEKGQTSLDVII